MVEYHQNASKNCCFNSLASAFTATEEKNATRNIAIQLEEFFIFSV